MQPSLASSPNLESGISIRLGPWATIFWPRMGQGLLNGSEKSFLSARMSILCPCCQQIWISNYLCFAVCTGYSSQGRVDSPCTHHGTDRLWMDWIMTKIVLPIAAIRSMFCHVVYVIPVLERWLCSSYKRSFYLFRRIISIMKSAHSLSHISLSCQIESLGPDFVCVHAWGLGKSAVRPNITWIMDRWRF